MVVIYAFHSVCRSAAPKHSTQFQLTEMSKARDWNLSLHPSLLLNKQSTSCQFPLNVYKCVFSINAITAQVANYTICAPFMFRITAVNQDWRTIDILSHLIITLHFNKINIDVIIEDLHLCYIKIFLHYLTFICFLLKWRQHKLQLQ